MNGWWPSECPHCATGEEADPYLFWNATVAGLAVGEAVILLPIYYCPSTFIRCFNSDEEGMSAE